MLSTLKVGTVVDSRYEIVEHLGDGGMGSVFKARELGLERFVALKMLHPSLVGDSEHRERFKREGAFLANLEHPHIIRCFRFGLWKETFPYIAMEFLSGESLTRVISADGTLGAARVLTIGKQICDAMQYAHESRIIHRDLKPANVMLIGTESQDFVKVLDFGLARLLPDPNQVSQHLTQTGELIGSVHYMSPEQCLGKKSDARSDIYSLGCLLYEALAGAPPFVADTPVRLIHMHVHAYPPPLEKCLNVQLPPGLNSILMRAMAKNPKDRHQSMGELRAALELVADGCGKEIPVLSPVSNPALVRNTKPPAYLVGCSIVALLVLAVVLAFNKKESVQLSSTSSSLSATSGTSSSGEFSQSPLSKYLAERPVLSPGEVERLEQGTARLQRYIDSGKDTVPVSSANAMVGKLKILESVYWSQQRYDDWYALTDRLLKFELIASSSHRSRCDQLAEILEGTYWLSAKTSSLPEGTKWKDRTGQCRKQLKELENRADDPPSILTLRLTNSVQCAREGRIPEALDEIDKALKAPGVLDLLAGDSSASYYWASMRVESTMHRLMDSAVCNSDEDVVSLCRMVLRLATICSKSRTELASVSEFCRVRLKKTFPEGKVSASLRAGYDDLTKLLEILGSKSDETVARDLVDLKSGFDYENTAKVFAKIHYFAEWLGKHGEHPSLSSVRAHCYLGTLYRKENYEAALEQSKIAVSEFEQVAKNADVIKATNRGERERTGELIELALMRTRGFFRSTQLLLQNYSQFLGQEQKARLSLAYASYLSASGLYTEEEAVRKQILSADANSRALLARCLFRRKKSVAGLEGFHQSRLDMSVDRADWPCFAPEALLEMGRIDDAFALLNANKKRADAERKGDRYSSTYPAEMSTSVCFRALILSLQRRHREAEEAILAAIRHAPAAYRYSFKLELLPVCVWNRVRSGQSIAPILKEFGSEPKGNVSWIMRAAIGAKTVNPDATRKLAHLAAGLLLKGAREQERATGEAAQVAELLIESGDVVLAKRLLVNTLDNATGFGGDAAELARIQLAYAELTQNNPRKAHEELDTVSELHVKPETLRKFFIAKAAVLDAEGKRSEAAVAFRRAYEMMHDSPRVEVMAKVSFLENYACFCERIGRKASAKGLRAEAEAILPASCRGPWRSWKSVTPLYPDNRPVGLFDG